MTQTKNFGDFIITYLNDRRSSMRKDTYYTYKSTATKLNRFRNNVAFDDINEKFIEEYRMWMLSRGNNENTTSKSLRTLRTWVNVAMRYDLIKRNPFQWLRIKKVDGKREFLKPEEFNLLFESQSLFKGIEAEVLKYFLFSCLTGLRYSDLRNLKYDNIKDNIISVRMQKTTMPVTIPISKKAQSLIEMKGTGHVFRVYCNKVTNRVLKSVISKCGINKKVTFHVARHTFATISITLGIPIEVVSKLLGHTDIKTTQIYAKVIDSVKIKEMNKWDSL